MLLCFWKCNSSILVIQPGITVNKKNKAKSNTPYNKLDALLPCNESTSSIQLAKWLHVWNKANVNAFTHFLPLLFDCNSHIFYQGGTIIHMHSRMGQLLMGTVNAALNGVLLHLTGLSSIKHQRYIIVSKQIIIFYSFRLWWTLTETQKLV